MKRASLISKLAGPIIASGSLYAGGDIQAQSPFELHLPKIEQREQEIRDATVEKLVELLDASRNADRQAAENMLIRKAQNDMEESGQSLSWTQDLELSNPTPSQQAHLARVARAIEIKEMDLYWNGMQIPKLDGFTHGKKVPALPCLCALNAEMGGLLDMERLMLQHVDGHDDRMIYLPKEGEPFWQLVVENMGSFAFYTARGRLVILPFEENLAGIAYEGAICTKLRISEGTLNIDFIPDPRLTNLAQEVAMCEVMTADQTYIAKPEYSMVSTSSRRQIPIPENLQEQDIVRVVLHCQVSATPMVLHTIENLSEPSEEIYLGNFSSKFQGLEQTESDEFYLQHTLQPCFPADDYFKVMAYRIQDKKGEDINEYFTIYSRENGVHIPMYSHVLAIYKNREDYTINYGIGFSKKPDRLDIHVPDTSQNVVGKKITIDIPIKK